jgi:hypothetical protein
MRTAPSSTTNTTTTATVVSNCKRCTATPSQAMNVNTKDMRVRYGFRGQVPSRTGPVCSAAQLVPCAQIGSSALPARAKARELDCTSALRAGVHHGFGTWFGKRRPRDARSA